MVSDFWESFKLDKLILLSQGAKVGLLGRQNEKNSSYVWLAHTSIFGLCFMSICVMKSNCYSLLYPWLNEYTNCGMSNGVAANVGVKSKSGTNSDCDWS